MWKLIYNLLLYLALPFFLIFAVAKSKIRKSLGERLWGTTEGSDLRDAIWIHGASVGEAAIARNIIEYMRDKGEKREFLVTTNTYYTRDFLRKRLGPGVAVFSLPFDLNWSVKRFIGSSSFKALILVETEIWPNLIWQARKRGIPVFIVNGRISDATLGVYRRFSFFIGKVLSDVTLVLAQSEEHALRFLSIGLDPTRLRVTGNLKYYQKPGSPVLQDGREEVFTFGSIKEKEVAVVLSVLGRLKKEFPNLLFFVAPRELHLTERLLHDLDGYSMAVVRYSKYKEGVSTRPDVVVVDTVGDLLSIYGVSRVAFVGGSLAPYGGQNMLEPLIFGTPVLFGPYVENFRDVAHAILEAKAGILVNSEEQLYEKAGLLLRDSQLRKEMTQAALTIAAAQRTPMEKTVQAIEEYPVGG